MRARCLSACMHVDTLCITLYTHTYYIYIKRDRAVSLSGLPPWFISLLPTQSPFRKRILSLHLCCKYEFTDELNRLAPSIVCMCDKKLCGGVEHTESGKYWPADKAGKVTGLGTGCSRFGVTGSFFPPLKKASNCGLKQWCPVTCYF